MLKMPNYYARLKFGGWQGANEVLLLVIAQQICCSAEGYVRTDEIKGAKGLINHLEKVCFVQGLSNDRVRTIVKAKDKLRCSKFPLMLRWMKTKRLHS